MTDRYWAPLDSEDYELFRQAADEGDTQRLATLVKDRKIDLNAVYGDEIQGLTILHEAAAHGREDTIRFLLDHGVAVDVLDEDRFGCTTPLFHAARNVKDGAIRMLLDAGADITVKGPNENTVGSALLPDAVKVTHDHIRSIKLLLDRGFDVNASASEYGPTVLEQAIKAGSHPLIELLLDKGASLDDSLRVAAEFHQTVDTIHFLIDRGAKDPYSHALTRAVCWNKSEIAKVLLARSGVIASDTKSANAMPMAARMGHLNMVELLLDHGLEIDRVDDLGQTPLMAACGANQPSGPIVQTLLRRGASVKARTPAVSGSPYQADDTPLHAAAWRSHPDIVQELLRAGADLTSRNAGGETPLLKFARNITGQTIQTSGSKRVLNAFRLLLEAGSDVDARDLQGRTALHIIAANHFLDTEDNRLKASELLLAKGADRSVRDSEGKVAADLLKPQDAQLRNLMEGNVQVSGTT